MLALLAGLAFAGPLEAQVRTLPAEAKGGTLRHVHDRIVEIDGKPQRLAPGAQIRDTFNRLLVPTLVPPGAKVRYLLDGEGQVHRVWILTPEEAAGAAKRP